MAQLKSSISIDVKVTGAKSLTEVANDNDRVTASVKRLTQAAQQSAQAEKRLQQGMQTRIKQQAEAQFRLEQGATRIAQREEQRQIRAQLTSARMAQRDEAMRARHDAAAQKFAAREEQRQIRVQLTSARMAQQAAAREEAVRARRTMVIERNQQRVAVAAERSAEREKKALITVEGEMTRLQRIEERRAAGRAARERLGMPMPGQGGSFLSGHGFLNRGRQALGAMRDLSVAGWGLYGAAQMGVGMARSVFDPYRHFQSSLADARNKGGFSAGETADIGALAMQMGRTTQFSPTQAAGASVELAAAGLHAGEIKRAMPSTLRFAQASGLGTEQSSGLLVETMSQFGLAATDFDRIGDSLVKSANMSTISVADLSESLKYAGPIARAAGQDLESTAAVIGFLGERGVKGSQAGTSLRGIFGRMAKPTKSTMDALAMVGLSKADLQGGLSDMPGFFEKLGGAMDTKKLTKAQRLEVSKGLFGQEAMTSGVVLTQSTAAWRNFEKGVRSGTGAMAAAATVAGDTLDGKLAKLNATMETSKITLAEKFLPTLDRWIPKMTEAAGATGDWISRNGDMVSTMTKLAGFAGGAKLASMVPGAGAAVSALGTAAQLGASQLFLPTAAQLTVAGATAGQVFAAAAVAAIAGYGIGKALIAALDLEPEEWGSKMYDLINGTTTERATGRGTGGGKITIAQAIEAERRKREGYSPTGSGPMSNESWDAAGGVAASDAGWVKVGAGQQQAPFVGTLEISLTSEGKPRVMDLQTTGQPLKVGVNVRGQ